MHIVLALALVSASTCTSAIAARSPQDATMPMPKSLLSSPSTPVAPNALATSAATSQHLVNTNLIATWHMVFGSSHSKSIYETLWSVAFLVVCLLALGFLVVNLLVSYFPYDEQDSEATQPLKQPAEAHTVYGLQPTSPEKPQQLLPVQVTTLHAPVHPTLSGQILSASSLGSGFLRSPFQSKQQPPPTETPAASGLLTSIWSSGSRPSLPPQLCPIYAPGENMTSFKIDRQALTAFPGRHTIEIRGAFDYPVAYVRLGMGAEGSRLEMVTEPSWNEVEVTIGPLAWPGNLGHDALIHGPQRELYGSFSRVGTSYIVSHFSQPGAILTLTPKKVANGISVEVSSRSGKKIATVIDQGSTFQIDVGPGVDGFLIIASVLATFVASQFLIDELHTTV